MIRGCPIMSNSDEKLNKSGWFPTPPWRFTMRFISMARYRDVGAVGAAVQVGPLLRLTVLYQFVNLFQKCHQFFHKKIFNSKVNKGFAWLVVAKIFPISELSPQLREFLLRRVIRPFAYFRFMQCENYNLIN